MGKGKVRKAWKKIKVEQQRSSNWTSQVCKHNMRQEFILCTCTEPHYEIKCGLARGINVGSYKCRVGLLQVVDMHVETKLLLLVFLLSSST